MSFVGCCPDACELAAIFVMFLDFGFNYFRDIFGFPIIDGKGFHFSNVWSVGHFGIIFPVDFFLLLT